MIDRFRRAWRWLRLDAHELSTAQCIWAWVSMLVMASAIIAVIILLAWSSMVWESYMDSGGK